jgi:myb proto-oncogene protein
LTAEDVAKASPELGLPSTRSEERVVDAGNIDKGRRKSTPRYATLLCHLSFFMFWCMYTTLKVMVDVASYISFAPFVYRPKQIDMSEGDADKHSPSTRLANCLSFARMKGTDRNRR